MAQHATAGRGQLRHSTAQRAALAGMVFGRSENTKDVPHTRTSSAKHREGGKLGDGDERT